MLGADKALRQAQCMPNCQERSPVQFDSELRACRWLVEDCNVNPDVATGDGTTPFHYAVWQGHLALCKWFVYGAACDFASENEFGCNAMQWAAQTDNLAMCRWLAALGLDVSLINNNGHSALHKAANKGQACTCAWLINEECLGSQHMQPDQDGNTPALMARLDGFCGLADALDAAAAALWQQRQGVRAGTLQSCAVHAPDDHPFQQRDSNLCQKPFASKYLAGSCTGSGEGDGKGQPSICAGAFQWAGITCASANVIGSKARQIKGSMQKGSSGSDISSSIRATRTKQMQV